VRHHWLELDLASLVHMCLVTLKTFERIKGFLRKSKDQPLAVDGKSKMPRCFHGSEEDSEERPAKITRGSTLNVKKSKRMMSRWDDSV
jgi:hypothetical protein